MDAPTIAAALAGQKHVGLFPGPSHSVSGGPPCAHGVPSQAQSYTGTGPLCGTVTTRHIAHNRNSAMPPHRPGTYYVDILQHTAPTPGSLRHRSQPWRREVLFEYADKKPKKHKRSYLLQPMTSACAPCHAMRSFRLASGARLTPSVIRVSTEGRLDCDHSHPHPRVL
ncbi:hypothetical protein COCSADRAFT_270849 [Bipolaris sorokiniana ND90Pr]|jgi:hypothetical protein|uniref:Uncharacterized protein n=1 Tax=Cochliobolus sativus (strain ND90Pr / ATCC 201652) TaxID=665912 RepID=M2RNP4_COCSN|nr:uncharacterized protein COCSADRAFT_270849 [Bipolaris sorokiniana ND90Pr]EMD68254.1 hypothetical protein COCSADRAFT_270849 [Bipolaris sorokiniana ND90Pr]